MNRLLSAALFLVMLSLVACSGESKKVMIIAMGKVTVDGNNIKLEPGQYNEQAVSFNGKDRVVLNIQTPDGTDTVSMGDNGYYLLNLMLHDTLVGGVVNYGAAAARTRVNDDELSHLIDSTRKLILGTGASDATKTYFVLPRTIKRITSDFDAMIIGPFEGIPYQVDQKNGKVPEVYQMLTTEQQRTTLLDLFKRMK